MFNRVLYFMLTNMAVMAVIALLQMVLAYFGIGGGSQQLMMSIAMCAVFGFGGSLISLLMSKSMAKKSTGCRVITRGDTQQERWLLDTVRRQAKMLDIEMPEVAIFPSSAMNAFATGARKNASLVAVSEGLLTHMSQDEVEAVLGHEMAHVANGDMVTLTLIQGVVNTFVIFLSRMIAGMVQNLMSRRGSGSRQQQGGMMHSMGRSMMFQMVYGLLQTVFGFVAMIIVSWFSRRREFRADEGGARVASRDKMIAALERLRSGQPSDLPSGMNAFGIRPGRIKGFEALLRTHPPLERRIEALRKLPR